MGTDPTLGLTAPETVIAGYGACLMTNLGKAAHELRVPIDDARVEFELVRDEEARRRNMKIAAVTEDGTTISRHFGRAPFYLVVTVENGNIVGRERREKMGHAHFAGNESTHHSHQIERHGFDAEAQDRHRGMAAAIADCEVLLAGGMGAGAYESMQAAGIRPLVTDELNIERAVQAFIAGTLVDHHELLH